MMSAMRGSGIGLVFTLLVLGVMIALCAVLLAPHLACRCMHRALCRPRHMSAARELDPTSTMEMTGPAGQLT